VFDFDLAKKNTVKQKTVFFVNKESKTVVETRGHICLNYLSIIPDRLNVIDFPISNERPQKKNKTDRISRFSLYTLRWDHGTFKVTKEPYLGFNPENADKLIAFNEEYALGNTGIKLENWKSVINDRGYTKFKDYRKLRESGTPTQILLHETADKGNQSITGGRLDDDGVTWLIPHFCVNNIDDKTQTGNIIQLTDVAERLYHGEPSMNDRSVGIEFVNPPIEAYPPLKDDPKKLDMTKPKFKLDQAKDGIYLRTVIKTYPYGKLFIPLEFSADNKSKNYFELSIPSDKVINAASLKLIKINNTSIVTEKDKTITIKYCKSEKYEHLCTLVKKLCEKDILDVDLTKFETWKCNTKENDKELFVFNRAWKKEGDADLYWLDIRKKGIYCHGFTGHHSDGYLPAIYCFLKFYQKLDKHEDALKKMINLLIKGTITTIKRNAVVQLKDRKFSDFTGTKEIEIVDCIVM
jgi:hypothetical protein